MRRLLSLLGLLWLLVASPAFATITLVGTSTGTNTCTFTTHSIGDLLVVYAYRNTTGTPALGSGFTSVLTKTGTTSSARLGVRSATATNDAAGTWTNATATVCHVYHTSTLSTGGSIWIGGSASNSATTNTVNYPALTMTNGGGTSWVAGFAGTSNTSQTIATAPSLMTNESHETASATQAAGHDTEGTVSSWSSTNVTTTGTAGDSVSATMEIVENVPAASSISNIIQRKSSSYDNTGLDNSLANNFNIILPNATLANNGLGCALEYPSGSAPTGITDNESNTWSATPLVTADAGAGNLALSFYYIATAATGTQQIVFSFGASTAVNPVKAWCYELYNVTGTNEGTAEANAVNTGGVVSAGSFTPSANSIILTFMTSTSNGVTTPTGIMPANNYTLYDADISAPNNGMPFASAVYLQPSAAATVPLFNLQNGGTGTYNIIAVALSTGSQGTRKPSGIHIDGESFFSSSGPGTKWKLQVPSHEGNLSVISMVADAGSTSSVDSLGNTWSSKGVGNSAVFYYEPNITSGDSGRYTTLTYTSAPSNVFCIYYEISGAATAPFDVYANTGNQTAVTNSIPNAPDITTTGSNELVLATQQMGTGPPWGPGVAGPVTSPSGAITDYDWYDAAEITAGISGTTMTVASTQWGANPLYNGNSLIQGSGVTLGTTVNAGTGPTYTIAPTQTVSSGTTIYQLDPDGNTLNWGNASMHVLVATASSLNVTWSVPYQQGGASGAIAFKQAPAAATSSILINGFP